MINVLIVDDDRLARKGIIALLNWSKYNMQVVGDVQNGRSALEFIRTNEVHLVFVDIDMPEMDGIAFMEICSREKPEIRFVVLTFYEEFSYAQSVIRLGGLDYISKASLEFANSADLLERIEKKYNDRIKPSISFSDEEEKQWEKLKEEWNSLFWIFDSFYYQKLVEETRTHAPEVRRLERQIVKCVAKIDELLEQNDTDIPWFFSVDELLLWVDNTRNRYREGVYSSRIEFASILSAIKIIEKEFTDHLHSSGVAARIGISRSYFSVKFKKYVGCTFGDYVQKLRIQYSQKLLCETDLDVLEIAYKSGYEDVYYFNRLFKEKMHCSPREYRKQRREKEAE